LTLRVEGLGIGLRVVGSELGVEGLGLTLRVEYIKVRGLTVSR